MQNVLVIVVAGSFLLAAVFLGLITRAGREMRASGGPGIVPFELAESTREAVRHMRTWGPLGRAAAKRSIQWDFGFIVPYVLLLGSAALHVAGRADDAGYRFWFVLEMITAGLAVVTGILDCVENVELLGQLRAYDTTTDMLRDKAYEASRTRLRVARTAARLKFALASLIGISILVGFGVVEMSGRPSSPAIATTLLVVPLVAAAIYVTIARIRPKAETPRSAASSRVGVDAR